MAETEADGITAHLHGGFTPPPQPITPTRSHPTTTSQPARPTRRRGAPLQPQLSEPGLRGVMHGLFTKCGAVPSSYLLARVSAAQLERSKGRDGRETRASGGREQASGRGPWCGRPCPPSPEEEPAPPRPGRCALRSAAGSSRPAGQAYPNLNKLIFF